MTSQKPPDAPKVTPLRATGTSPWDELTWQAPTEDANGGTLTGVQRYEILRAPQGETPNTVINTYHVTTDPTFRDLEVRSGETWTYAVRAVDFDGHVGAASFIIHNGERLYDSS